MLALLISGQDIRELSLGLVRDGRLVGDVVVPASPERYLSAIAATLAGWNVRAEDLDALAVVTGPGSFTSSRVSTTIANAIAFAMVVETRLEVNDPGPVTTASASKSSARTFQPASVAAIAERYRSGDAGTTTSPTSRPSRTSPSDSSRMS